MHYELLFTIKPKSMKRNYSILLMSLLILTSCQNDFDEFNIDSSISNSEMMKVSNAKIKKNIIVNIKSNHFGGYHAYANTRGEEEYSLKPFIYRGDTVMYVAQYKDGWELYSTDVTENMIVCSSPTGKFDLYDSDMPDALRSMIMNHAQKIVEGRNDASKNVKVDPSWGALAVTDEDLSNGKIKVLGKDGAYSAGSNQNLPPGHWELIEVKNITKIVDETPKLTKTEWGQDEPWNEFSDYKLDLNTNTYRPALAGCGPVAIAQYEYTTHFKDNTPELHKIFSMFDTETQTWDFFTFRLVDFEWYRLALTKEDYYFASNTALFIGYIGHKLKASYGLNGTGTDWGEYADYLSSTYGTPYHRLYFDKDKVINRLMDEFPVMARANSANETATGGSDFVGHAFLIDKYQKEVSQEEFIYAWIRDPLPPQEAIKWIEDLKDENGNIIKYAYMNTEVYINSIQEDISMNWGWNGSYNDVNYSISGDWNPSKYHFNYNTMIFIPE